MVSGVDSSSAMGAAGQTATVAAPGFSWMNSVLPGFMRGGSSQPATQKAPGKRWDIPVGGDAKLLESTGAGAQILEGAIKEMRRTLCDATGVILVDPQTLGSGDLSARALTLMHAPMLDVADNLRVEYGDALVRIVNAFLRLCANVDAANDVALTSWGAARAVLAKLSGATADGGRRWLGATIDLAWGPYFEPSSEDKRYTIDNAMKANGGRPVASLRTSVAMASAVLGVEDVDAEVEDIEEEQGADRDHAARAMGALAGERESTPPDAPTTDAPDVTITDPAAGDVATTAPAGAAVADTALNGAQVTSMVDIVKAVASGELPRDSAKAIIMRAFAVDDVGADAILGSAGGSFTTTKPAPPMPFGGAPDATPFTAKTDAHVETEGDETPAP